MKSALKSIGGNSQARANVVDGKLILSFPHALTPVVWQMDLNQAKSSALEVRESPDDKHATLILKTTRGEVTEIAPFETRGQAVDALMAVSRALENAHGQIRTAPAVPVETVYAERPQGKKGIKWLAVALGLVMLFILLNIWGALLPHPVSTEQNATSTPSSAPAEDGENGVPLSADKYLNTP